MNIDKLIHDLRARINPQYYDQIGTESYERHQVVKALEYLHQENERLRKDAERYRWLRDCNGGSIGITTIHTDECFEYILVGTNADAAIDAARGGK